MSEKSKRGLEFSISAVFVLALLLVGAVLIFSGGTASAKQIATLQITSGPVDVKAKGTDAFEPGTEGQSLHEGDTVRTGSTGRASIVYFDDSVTRLDFDTTFTMKTLETLDNANESKVIQGEQGEGNSYNRVEELTDSESRFEVETPTATASVQGTVYALIVDNGATTVAVIDGVVKTSSGGDTATVPAGKMVVVDANGGLGLVQTTPDELLSSPWLSYNLCDVDDDDTCVGGEIVSPPGKPEKEPKPPKEHPDSLPPVLTTIPGGDGAPPLNQPPVAGFTASPSAGPAPLQVRFEDASSDPEGDSLSRQWSFGDGAAQNGGIGPTHTYGAPGVYTVTLTVQDPDGQTDSKSKDIVVQPPPPGFDHIVISPSNATIEQGDSQNYTAEAFDTDGQSMGNVTANTSFTIAPNGSCSGNTCTANQPGTHTVTGTYSGDSDTATLVVEEPPPPPPPPCPNYALSFHTRPPTSVEAGKQFNVQIRVDVLEGGSADGPLTISLSLSGGSFSGGDTSVTWTGQGTLTFNHLTIDDPGSYSMSGGAACASSTDASPITVTDGGSNALGLVFLVPGLFPAMRSRRRR